MARVSTYLNFPRQTEAAFNFYRQVFGGEFTGGIHRFKDAPPNPSCPTAPADAELVMHIELPILAGHVLMGADAPESMGFALTMGNNIHLNLEPDTRAEALRLFQALSEGGRILMPLQDMFWGAYFGNVVDRFGVHWMVNCNEPA
ncbi:MAG: VOC family protein [Proteobacteria bacterium]|uniref:VOC family protein n=1 Tax=Aquabacterium sp. TaxID=1872578 RepID=UPI0035C6B5AF|nr:VOC family protein [Pseudomonadota bacterium]